MTRWRIARLADTLVAVLSLVTFAAMLAGYRHVAFATSLGILGGVFVSYRLTRR